MAIERCGYCNGTGRTTAGICIPCGGRGETGSGNPAIETVQVAITIRDQFAMAALTGMMASDVASGWTQETVSQDAYAIADAMLEARKGE